MSCRYIFITPDDYKNRVDISENVNPRYVIPYAAVAQDRYLKGILCNDLYAELEEQSISDTLTEANETLINEYIKPFLVFKTYENYLAYANYKSTPAGIISTKGEDYELVSDAGRNIMIRDTASNAKYYEGVLKKYLEDNKDTFTQWREQCFSCADHGNGSFKITSVGGRYNKKDRKNKNDRREW